MASQTDGNLLPYFRAASTDHDQSPHMKSRPSVKELMKELDSVVDWPLLLLHMGMEKYENDKIERNFNHDVDRQKMEAFDQWLKKTPNACWKNVIDALYQEKYIVLATELEKKYHWKDPRVSVGGSFLSAAFDARITAVPIGGIPCRKFLPPLNPGLDYYTFEDCNVRPIESSAAEKRTATYSRLMNTNPYPYNLTNFFESIERSNSKGDFKVGLEARFGRVYWKFNPSELLPPLSTRKDWIKSKLLRKVAFNTEVEEPDVDRLFTDRKLLVKGSVTRITLKFIVERQNAGIYSAIIATYDDEEMFCLDAVYREPKVDKRAVLNVSMPGRKYDFRIGECTECALLAEHKNSVPYQMAQIITSSLCRLPDRKLHVKLRGSLPDGNSEWKVKYIRQRVQKQYEWKPERKWILARYDVDVFQYETNSSVDVNTAPLNEGVDIPEFDYSRIEVELWCQKIFPSNVNDTNPSRKKYYYMEGIEGVKLPGGELREPYNWTTGELLEHFEEFVGDAFRIAHILDGTPY